MKRLLIAVASRHGGTRAIAEALADTLRSLGIEVELREAREVDTLAGYDALILGSAVYMGDWLPEARRVAARFRDALGQVPVWMFSSGPLGREDPQPRGEPERIADLLQAIRPRGHQVFAGRLEPAHLGLRERLLVRLVHAPVGDFRDWEAVRAWARQIAADVTSSDGATKPATEVRQ